jgi:hypothetical protein
MVTVFQKNIKVDDLMAVTKMLHPDLPDGWEVKFSSYRKYTWVCVSFKIKWYGNIDFGIDNHHQPQLTLYGPKITKAEMDKSLHNGEIDWNVWRFSLDKLSREREVIDKLPEEPCITEAKAYIKSRYHLPSVNEFHHIYYED